MVDDRTPHLGLPLPHLGNPLAEDVGRLRASFSTLDSRIAAIEGLLNSDDVNLDTLQELVTALKSDQAGLASVMAALAGKADAATVGDALAAKADVTVVNDALSDFFALQLALQK